MQEVRKIVLNVGCGNKLTKSTEEHYIVNIDTVPPKDSSSVTLLDFFDKLDTLDTSKPLFLLDDAVKLTWVPDDIADELHAYHLIEHFPPYDVPKILRRWYEVLKPEGIIALEQPDVVKCAMNLLQMVTNPESHVGFNLGLLGFYGAQDPEQPLMAHKYGWTFNTLSPVMFGAGFRDIEEHFAQTHAKTKRDFRVEGTKR